MFANGENAIAHARLVFAAHIKSSCTGRMSHCRPRKGHCTGNISLFSEKREARYIASKQRVRQTEGGASAKGPFSTASPFCKSRELVCKTRERSRTERKRPRQKAQSTRWIPRHQTPTLPTPMPGLIRRPSRTAPAPRPSATRTATRERPGRWPTRRRGCATAAGTSASRAAP